MTKIIACDDSNNREVENTVKKHHSDVYWTKGSHNGPGANRNYGLKFTTTTCEWIIFIDDDCYVNEDFINMIKNKTKITLNSLTEDQITTITSLSGVQEFPMRVKCATMAWHTCLSAVEKK